MRLPFLVLVLLVLLVGIAGAQTVDYTCPSGMAIYELQITSPSSTTGTIDLKYSDGSIVHASWSYQPHFVFDYPLETEASITLDGKTDSQVFPNPGQIWGGAYSLIISFYPARNITELADNRLIMGAGLTGIINDISVEKDGVNSAIIGFTIISDNEITYTKQEDKLSTIVENLKSANLDDAIALVVRFFNTTVSFIETLFKWLKFFFIDHVELVVALILVIPMAFAAQQSKGRPDRFLRAYFRTLKGFFEFFILVWHTFIDIIGIIRGWFKLI